MIKPFLLAALTVLSATTPTSLTLQFQVNVDGVSIEGPPEQAVKIDMPTKRYTCQRLPLFQDEDSFSVGVACDENGKPAFMTMAVCRKDVPDADVALTVVNVAGLKEVPQLVPIMLGCRSFKKATVL